MNFYRIKITAWRDRVERQPAALRNAEIGQVEAQIAELTRQLETDRARKGVDAAHLKTLETALAEVTLKRAATMTDEEMKALGTAAAAGLHPMVNREGYQVVDEAAGRVLKLVDADGNEFPPDAAIEYELVDARAPAPPWADAKLGEWFPKDVPARQP